MRVAAGCQLVLPIEPVTSPAERWGQLSEQARVEVLVLLAQLIARGVLIEQDAGAADRLSGRAGAGGG
jgi:hypothetical protein